MLICVSCFHVTLSTSVYSWCRIFQTTSFLNPSLLVILSILPSRPISASYWTISSTTRVIINYGKNAELGLGLWLRSAAT